MMIISFLCFGLMFFMKNGSVIFPTSFPTHVFTGENNESAKNVSFIAWAAFRIC